MLADGNTRGGNYTSMAFIKKVKNSGIGGGKSYVTLTGKGLLSAANPLDSAVPPSAVVGSRVLPPVFPSVHRVFSVTVRIVPALSYALAPDISSSTKGRDSD